MCSAVDLLIAFMFVKYVVMASDLVSRLMGRSFNFLRVTNVFVFVSTLLNAILYVLIRK
jgi:hypothetical protein